MTRRETQGAARRSGILWLGLLAIPLLVSCQSGQRHFETPEAAADALISAARTHDVKSFEAIFGSEHRELFETEDVTSNQEAQTDFAMAADERLSLDPVGPDTIEMVVGEQEWPLPIPLVKETQGWRFDTAAGIEEVLNRRVGRNELEAIELMRAAIEAQALYQSRDWDGDGIADYAMHVKGDEATSRYDGLYWEADVEAGEEPSPLHDFVLDSRDYYEARKKGEPWRGYYVQLMTRQGPNAPGGAMDLMEDGRLMHGFAIVAWPSNYGSTGVMTFIASHHGAVHEKDLGDETTEVAEAMTVFDPGEGWAVVK